MQTATFIVDLVLSILTLVVVFLAWRSMRQASESNRLAERAFEQTAKSLELIRLDFRMRYRPLKYRIVAFEKEARTGLALTLEFASDSMSYSRVKEVYLVEEGAEAFTILTPEGDTSVAPGGTRSVTYRGPSRDLERAIEAGELVLKFRDSFSNDYTLKDPRGHIGFTLQGDESYDSDEE